MRRVIAGPRAVEEALRSAQAERLQAVCFDKPGRWPQLVQLAQACGVAVEEVPTQKLQSMAAGLRHQGVVAVAEGYTYQPFEHFLGLPAGSMLLALDEISDPHNLGAMLRSAVAFKVDGVVLPKHRAAHVTGAVVRSSAGATEHAQVAIVSNLSRALQQLHALGWRVIGLAAEGDATLAQEAAQLGDDAPSRVLVVGSEGEGLRRLVRGCCDRLVSIPLPGPVASLNASVAASVALYHLTQVPPKGQ